MERSNYQEFMDYYKMFEGFARAAITTDVAFEYIEQHRASGAPFTKADEDAAIKEIELRLDAMRAEINTYALITWAEEGIKRKYGQSDEKAADE